MNSKYKQYWYILFVLLVLSCSTYRKINTTSSKEDSVSRHTYDSVLSVYKKVSKEYEQLKTSSNNTGVVFETIPCDSGSIGGAGMPHIIEHADGSREFIGRIKSYQSDVATYQRAIFNMQSTIDSLMSVSKSDTTSTHKETATKNTVIKKSFIPWWIWLLVGIGGLGWLATIAVKKKFI